MDADVATPIGSTPEERAGETHAGDLVEGLPPAENKKFYPALDGLRAVAVLMVFCQHYMEHPGYLRWGWTGVNIFFVLSGFLITGILYDTRDAPNRFRTFYVRRTLRIFPLYYGVLLLGLLLTPVFHWVWHPVWLLWLVYLGNYGRFLWMHDFQTLPYLLDHLLSGWRMNPPMVFYLGHFWSLCVEEQFYLAWPLVVFFVRDRIRLRNICIGAFFVCLAARCVCGWLLPRDLLSAGFLDRVTPLRVDSLLLGGLLALCLRGPEAAWIKRCARPVMATVGCLFVAMQVFYLVTTHHLYDADRGAWWTETIGLSLIDLFAAALVLRSIDDGSTIYRLLGRRWLRRLGQMSYGFYVFHDIPHVAYTKLVFYVTRNRVAHTAWMVDLLALFGTTVLAYLSFRFFEAPFLRLKDRFTA